MQRPSSLRPSQAPRKSGSGISVRAAGGAFSPATRQVDAKTREMIDRKLAERGGRR